MGFSLWSFLETRQPRLHWREFVPGLGTLSGPDEHHFVPALDVLQHRIPEPDGKMRMPSRAAIDWQLIVLTYSSPRGCGYSEALIHECMPAGTSFISPV